MKLCHKFVLICMAVLLWAAVSEASPLKPKQTGEERSVALPRQSGSSSAAAAVDEDDEDDDDDGERVQDNWERSGINNRSWNICLQMRSLISRTFWTTRTTMTRRMMVGGNEKGFARNV